MTRLIILSLLSTALACTDFASPAELEDVQILAVQATPPAVPPGGASSIRVLCAGPNGVVIPTGVDYQVDRGSIDADGTYYALASSDAGSYATVQVDVDVDGRILTAVKSIELTNDRDRRNPTILELSVDGALVQQETPIALGQGAQLSLATEGDEETFVAWYSNIATIDRYRSNPTEVDEVSGETGDLIAVVRDGRGGVSWIRAAASGL